MKELAKQYLKEYDLKINTLDDIRNESEFRRKINYAIASMRNLQHISDEQAMSKCKTDKERVEALFKNQSKSWYVEFNKSCDYLLSVAVMIDSIFELKNIRTEENFNLRAELIKNKL